LTPDTIMPVTAISPSNASVGETVLIKNTASKPLNTRRTVSGLPRSPSTPATPDGSDFAGLRLTT
jgi:hypothetical protein